MRIGQSRPNKRRDSSLVYEYLNDEVVLYDEKGNTVHVLNATAKLIWELCDGVHSLEEIEQAIRSNFSGLEDRDIAQDILKVIDIFRRKGLLMEPV